MPVIGTVICSHLSVEFQLLSPPFFLRNSNYTSEMVQA